MSALGLDVHGKDPETVSDEEQSSDEESEVSDTGSEARAGRRARIRRAEDEDDEDSKDAPDELEPWVVPEKNDELAMPVQEGGLPSNHNDTAGSGNSLTGPNAHTEEPRAAPSTSQTGDASTQTSRPPRSKGDRTKAEKKERKKTKKEKKEKREKKEKEKEDKNEGSSQQKQPEPEPLKPQPAAESNEADVVTVDEGESKGKGKRTGGYVNHERVKTGGSDRAKLTDEELAARMERIRLQNEKIKEKRQEVLNDEEEFNKISAGDIDVRQRKERQARLQAEVERERQKVAQKKLAQLQNRAWDAGKKGPVEQASAPPPPDKKSFWGTSKVEANGDIKPPSGGAEGVTEATAPGRAERGRGRGRGFHGRGRGEGGRGRGRPPRTSNAERPPQSNGSNTEEPIIEVKVDASSQVEGQVEAK